MTNAFISANGFEFKRQIVSRGLKALYELSKQSGIERKGGSSLVLEAMLVMSLESLEVLKG
jgi:hypothetical protein